MKIDINIRQLELILCDIKMLISIIHESSNANMIINQCVEKLLQLFQSVLSVLILTTKIDQHPAA